MLSGRKLTGSSLLPKGFFSPCSRACTSVFTKEVPAMNADSDVMNLDIDNPFNFLDFHRMFTWVMP